MIAEKIPQLSALSAEEKLILVGELWDQLSSEANAFPPREDHVEILRNRLKRHQESPEDVIVWEDLKARILARQ